MSDEQKPSVRLFSHEDDTPKEARGALIPSSLAVPELTVGKDADSTFKLTAKRAMHTALLPIASTAVLALVLFGGYSIAPNVNNAALVPSVTIVDPYTNNQRILENGPEEALSDSSVFTDVRDAFVTEKQTFVEVDITGSSVRYYENGILEQESEIIARGEHGSWWDIPSGIYEVTGKQERHFSEYTQTYFPWSLVFEGNYLLHGVPEYAAGSVVAEDFTGGGVRLQTSEAELLFNQVEEGTTVLVRALAPKPQDRFVYTPIGPETTAREYLVADIDSGTILTAKGKDDVVSIASLTKLMTAVVTAEKISLDKRVYVLAPTFVQSLIPRLAERSSVSMYSLLQILLVESSNEAAEVIAGDYGRDAFIEEMNNKARLVGMFDSNFADPSGLSADNRSSANDLFLLTKYIYDNRDFIFEITATGEAVGVEGGGEFSALNNFNEVEEIDNFIGGKIGETLAAGMTSISLHEIMIGGQKRTIAVIILGSSARNDDVKTLLNFVDENYE